MSVTVDDWISKVRANHQTIRALAGDATSLAEGEYLANWADSYSRIDVLLLAHRLSRTDWFTLLGRQWSSCDNIFRWRTELRRQIRLASRQELELMMEPAEREALARLPEKITVYRGCYQVNRSGLSWTLDRGVAEQFPSLRRYRREGDEPLLLTGLVCRDRVVLKLDNNEQEIISATVKVTGIEMLARVRL